MPDRLAHSLGGRRASDGHRFPRLKEWWDHWGALVTGGWMLFVSTGLLVLGVLVYIAKTNEDKILRNASVQAHVACLRGKEFGPASVKLYRPVVTPSQLHDLRKLIPTRCP